jgi:hypothetical protein
VSQTFIPYPNPNDGREPLSFYYNIGQPASRVSLKIFTVANRMIFKDDRLPTTVGQHPYVLNWGSAGLNLASGLYYFVLEMRDNGQATRQIMKVLVIR